MTNRDRINQRIQGMPEAIVRCELLECLDTLRALHDCQNGPPLLKWEDDWKEAMESAITLLRRFDA